MIDLYEACFDIVIINCCYPFVSIPHFLYHVYVSQLTIFIYCNTYIVIS